mmetsp:Transcript_42964/g.121578  ORF Transcript_42964/g.121578 Transcript_42964/m.121578 type:complete len:216 (-) Transcript_42964:84-731(-)
MLRGLQLLPRLHHLVLQGLLHVGVFQTPGHVRAGPREEARVPGNVRRNLIVPLRSMGLRRDAARRWVRYCVAGLGVRYKVVRPWRMLLPLLLQVGAHLLAHRGALRVAVLVYGLALDEGEVLDLDPLLDLRAVRARLGLLLVPDLGLVVLRQLSMHMPAAESLRLVTLGVQAVIYDELLKLLLGVLPREGSSLLLLLDQLLVLLQQRPRGLRSVV